MQGGNLGRASLTANCGGWFVPPICVPSSTVPDLGAQTHFSPDTIGCGSWLWCRCGVFMWQECMWQLLAACAFWPVRGTDTLATRERDEAGRRAWPGELGG
jgi:hypothetical protein